MRKFSYFVAVAAASLALLSACNKSEPAVDTVVEFEDQTVWVLTGTAKNSVEIPLTISGENVAYPLTISFKAVEGEALSVEGEAYTIENKSLTLSSASDKAVLVVSGYAEQSKLSAVIEIASVDNQAQVGEAACVVVLGADDNLRMSEGDFIISGDFYGLDGAKKDEYSEKWSTTVFPTFGGWTFLTGILGITNDGGRITSFHATTTMKGDKAVMTLNLGSGDHGANSCMGIDKIVGDKKEQYLVAPILTDRKGKVLTSGSISFEIVDGYSLKPVGCDEDMYLSYGLYGIYDGVYIGEDYVGYLALKDLKGVRDLGLTAE
ncbi:MAG: hypothetical protein ACI3Y7_05285 [Candidatus Cryptobacteroides sp.]